MSCADLRQMLFRPTQAPGAALPLGARSVGHYRVPPGWRDTPRVKHFVQVFWGVAGAGALVIEGIERRLEPRHVAIYLPGMEHHVYALAEPWEVRWFTMDGPLAAPVVTSFGLTAGVFSAGPAPHDLFDELTAAIRDITRDGELRASALAYKLLTRAAGGSRPTGADPRIQCALDRIHRLWPDPQLSVEKLARHVGLHRSAFARKFLDAVGIPPIVYITQLRIQNALSLLRQTDKPIAQISRECGYRDPNYFSRLMRSKFGLSAREVRAEGAPPTNPSEPSSPSHAPYPNSPRNTSKTNSASSRFPASFK
ncbi:MAG TPA: AraC family transcriptional regulator [Candidatus Brocadiia bacterium]|nr:AraC family transcriptional regulator [Candidatus Brocadiia bacterium]